MLHGKYFCLMTGVGGEARACSMQNTFAMQSPFLCQSNGDHKTAYNNGVISGHTLF